MDAGISVDTCTQVLPGRLAEEEKQRPKAPIGIKMGAIVTPLIEFFARNWLFVLLALSGKKLHVVQIWEMAGTLIGGVLIPAVVVLLFQIDKRFRSPRSRWTIFFCASLFLLVSHILAAFTKV